MRINRIGFRLFLIGAGITIDLENQTDKIGGRRQLLLRVIDKCMSAKQAGVNGFDRLLNAGWYVNPLLLWALGFSLRIEKMACRFLAVIELQWLLLHFSGFLYQVFKRIFDSCQFVLLDGSGIHDIPIVFNPGDDRWVVVSHSFFEGIG